MARKIVKVIVLATNEELTPDMYVHSNAGRGNTSQSQWDFVLSEAKRSQQLFKLVFDDEVSEDESGSRTYSVDELESMSMKDLIVLGKENGVKTGGLGKTDLVKAIAASMG